MFADFISKQTKKGVFYLCLKGARSLLCRIPAARPPPPLASRLTPLSWHTSTRSELLLLPAACNLQNKYFLKLFFIDLIHHCKKYSELGHEFAGTLHCKDTVPKLCNKYSKKRKSAASVCEWLIYSLDGSAYSAAGKYVNWSWENINCSQTQECGNWDWGRAIPFLGIQKFVFRCSVG